jgi:hypothetical protein
MLHKVQMVGKKGMGLQCAGPTLGGASKVGGPPKSAHSLCGYLLEMATGRVEQLPARQKKVTGRKSYLYPRLEIYTRIHTRWISVDIRYPSGLYNYLMNISRANWIICQIEHITYQKPNIWNRGY